MSISSVKQRATWRWSPQAWLILAWSLLAFVAAVALATVWLPNAHPIDWLAGIAFDEETIYSPGYSTWRWCQVRRVD
ncbi:MAG TPA: hypothetical protein VNH11_17165 [Pirellulales bacterium]|nr:hypothetical protein [Pirellulales bacterium]